MTGREKAEEESSHRKPGMSGKSQNPDGMIDQPSHRNGAANARSRGKRVNRSHRDAMERKSSELQRPRVVQTLLGLFARWGLEREARPEDDDGIEHVLPLYRLRSRFGKMAVFRSAASARPDQGGLTRVRHLYRASKAADVRVHILVSSGPRAMLD